MNTADFQLVPMSHLGEEHFAEHPIWSELYDFEERDEIASWGIDRQWLDDQIRGTDIGDEHWAYPVLVPQPLPARMRLYISATFTTPSGDLLRGFVTNPDAYCVTIFASGERFTFSSHPAIADLSHRSLDQLLRAVPGIHAIFPLQYHTDFHDEDGKPIQGTFHLPDRNG